MNHSGYEVDEAKPNNSSIEVNNSIDVNKPVEETLEDKADDHQRYDEDDLWDTDTFGSSFFQIKNAEESFFADYGELRVD